MKRTKLFFLLSGVLLFFLTSGFVEAFFWRTPEYGFIDLTRIQAEARRYSLLQEELDRLEQEFEAFREEVRAEHARKVRELTKEFTAKIGEDGIEMPVLEEEFTRRAEKLAEENQAKLDQKRAEIDRLKEERRKAVEDELKVIVEKVAKKTRVQAVLLKERIITGGRDLTDDVLKEWEKELAAREKREKK